MRILLMILFVTFMVGCTEFGANQNRTLKQVDKGGDVAKILAEMNKRENGIRAPKYQFRNIAKGAGVYIYDSPDIPMPMEEIHASINSDAKTKWDASSDETLKISSGFYWILTGFGFILIVIALILFVKGTKIGAEADGAVGAAGDIVIPMMESLGRACSKAVPGTSEHAQAESYFNKIKAYKDKIEAKYKRKI